VSRDRPDAPALDGVKPHDLSDDGARDRHDCPRADADTQCAASHRGSLIRRIGTWGGSTKTKTACERSFVIDMRSPCPTHPPQVKTDASHPGIRPSEAGSASADGHASPCRALTLGIAALPLAMNLVGLRCCTPESSTDAPGRTSSTRPPGARIGCRSSIVRRAWVVLPSPRTTRGMRFGSIGPILDPWGSSPVDGSGLGFLHRMARCRSFSQQRIIPHQTPTDDPRPIDPRLRSMTAHITPFRAPQPESRGSTQPVTTC